MIPVLRAGSLAACSLVLSVTSMPLLAQPNGAGPAGASATATRPTSVAPRDWLLEQLRLGEARHNEVLVDQALDRLAAIGADDPEVLEARVRRALRDDDLERAAELVARLAEQAPQSEAYHQARRNLALNRAEGRDALSRARLLAAAARLEQAKAAYDALFQGQPPTLPLALEYWQLVARLPGERARAITALDALEARYPHSPELGFALARLLFAAGRDGAARQRLVRLADDPNSRAAAARLWFDTLRGRPASQASVTAWQGFLEHFAASDYADEARATLAEQRALLADPAYQARQRGLARFENQQGTAGKADIERALNAYPDDVELLGALGIIRLRQGRHDAALTLFQRAQALDTSGFSGDKWPSLIATARYWQQVRRGDNALADGRLDEAERAYRRAAELDAGAPLALVGLGDVARARQDAAAAERAYRRALQREPGNLGALAGLAELYAEQSPARALTFIDALPADQRQTLAATRQRLRLVQLRAAAEQDTDRGDWAGAARHLRQARELAPDDVWLSYSLAQAWRELGDRQAANGVFADLLPRLEDDAARAQAHYAKALYLASDDRNAAALASLARVPAAHRDADIRALATRLERQQALARAERLRDNGAPDAARALLAAQSASVEIALRLGDWALVDADPAAARDHYRQALALAPESRDARLGLAEAALAMDENALASRQLEPLTLPATAVNERRRAANLWLALGDPARAERTIAAALETPAADGNALLWRDAARIAAANEAHTTALDRYRRGLVAAGLAEAAALDDDAAFTRATRSHTGDAWLAGSLRSDAAALYRQRDTRVRAARRVANDDGTDGVSSLTTSTDMLEIDTPLGDGRAFARLDRVVLDAGRLARDTDGLSRATFGTCAAVGCEVDGAQQDRGVSVALGWYDETWRVDIGTTPLGFAVEDWTGGLQYSGDAGPLWLTATLSRRALDDSLLAFAGAEDPRSGTTWGGIRATGASLGLGYDRGGPNGVWSNIGVHHLDGENVPDNTRVQVMGGVYHKLINAEHRRLSIGISSLMMHYSRELGGYSLGQGGYYSPQRYVSLSLPVSYTRRSGDWSWQLDAAISQSWTDSDDSARYPLGGGNVAGLPDAGATRSGGSGGGFGFSLGGRIEHRLTDHWIAGLAVDLQQAEDYAPNSFNLSLRYSFGAWQGDLAMPPDTLEPYASFD